MLNKEAMKKATLMLAAMMLVCGGWAVAQEPPKKESPVPDELPAPEEKPVPEEQPEPANPDQTSEDSELQLIVR